MILMAVFPEIATFQPNLTDAKPTKNSPQLNAGIFTVEKNVWL
jgi:hypothetical protein